MRVLMMTTPVATHFTPMIPLGWALRAAGDTVLVTGQPDIAKAAHGGGLSVAVVGDEVQVKDLVTAALPDGVRSVEVGGKPGEAQLAAGARVWIMHARYLVRSYLRLAREWAPDLIISDRLDFSAPIVGALLGVPVVAHRWGVDPIAQAAWGPAARTLRGLCRRFGLDGLPEPTMILDPSPPGMQVPGIAQGTPIRPVPSNGCGLMPDWALRRGAERRVSVSLGWLTLSMNGLPLLRNVIDACGALENTETIVTAEPEFRDRLGAVPPSVRVVDPLPLDLFLGGCDAVVHHGGSGTSITATAFGLPQIALPQYLDAFHVGERITACGVGLSLDDAAAQNDPAAIRDAVHAVLTKPGYAEAARELRQAVERMPPPADLVDLLRDVAATGRAAA